MFILAPADCKLFSKKAVKHMKKLDIITGILILILAGYIIVEALQMPKQIMPGRASYGPGSGFLPMWTGIFMAGLAIFLIVKASLQPTESKEKTLLPRGKSLIAVVLAVVGLVAYVNLLETLGFLMSTFLINGYLMFVVIRTEWKQSLLVSVCVAGSLYIIFDLLVGIKLPVSMFGV